MIDAVEYNSCVSRYLYYPLHCPLFLRLFDCEVSRNFASTACRESQEEAGSP